MIDAHVHTNWLGKRADDIVRHFDSIGVEKGWLLAWEMVEGFDPGYSHLSNESIFAAARAHPDRFIPFCAVDPHRRDAKEILKKWIERGARGFGEHKARMMIDNPDAVELYDIAGEHGMPVLFHMDTPHPGASFWYNADIDGLERLLKKRPNVAFIGHGPGFWRYVSGDAEEHIKEGYPKGKVAPGGKLVEMLHDFPNLHADISAGSGLNALRRDAEFGPGFVKEFSHKLLYGTDCFTREHLDFMLSLSLPDDVFQAITRENAVRLVRA